MEFYLDFIRTVFQAVDDRGKSLNRVVAFTSSVPGEGVSHVVSTLAGEIATLTQRRVLAVDSIGLQNLRVSDPLTISNQCSETHIENLHTIPVGTSESSNALRRSVEATEWQGDPECRLAGIKALRWNFDYVLIDCPSLSVSSDAATLASLIDGVAIVVAAGQTRRDQIRRAQNVIEQAGGNFLGFVLNQRSYPVPGWLYHRL